MLNTTWKLRVSEEDLAEWKVQAAESGMLLSEWIRARCNVKIGDGIKAFLPTAVAVEGREVPKKLVKACEHGVDKGYRCWQCGGLAKI